MSDSLSKLPNGAYGNACAMGNLYRFVEPVLLFLLKRKGWSYGYELAGELQLFSLTAAEIESAALYRTLRQLEKSGCVTSKWDMKHPGPARRMYYLTARGHEHLQEWMALLDHISKSMSRLVAAARADGEATAPASVESREVVEVGGPV